MSSPFGGVKTQWFSRGPADISNRFCGKNKLVVSQRIMDLLINRKCNINRKMLHVILQKLTWLTSFQVVLMLFTSKGAISRCQNQSPHIVKHVEL